MEKLRVALVSMHTDPFAPPGSGDVGGMNVIVSHAAQELVRAGHTVEVYSRRSDPQASTLTTSGSLTHHRIDVGPVAPATKAQQEAYIEDFSNRLRELISVFKPDLIHSHHWFSGVAALPIAQEQQVPHVQSYHSIAAREDGTWELGERPEGPGRVPAERMLASASDAIIAVSQAEAQTAIAIDAPAQRVHVATPGVDHAVFHPGDQDDDPFGLCNRPTVLVAARLEPLKGLELAIETLALLPADSRPRLSISGAPTGGFVGYDHELHALVNSLGMTKDVWFAGPLTRDELAAAMRHAHAVMVPSYSETYGLVALEAAACGTPVLAAKVGGLVDAVAHGRTGTLIEGRDPQVWARELQLILNDAAVRTAMAEAGVAFAREFTWEAMTAQWARVYSGLVR